MKKIQREKLTFIKFVDEFKVNPRRYVLYLCFLIVLLLLPGQNRYQTLGLEKVEPEILDLPFTVSKPASYPERTGGQNVPYLSASAVILMDVDSQVVLYEHNPNEKLLPASTTKIRTAVIALENYPLELVMPAKETIIEATVDASLMRLEVGDRVSARSLLYGLLLNSGADAAETLAQNFPGGKSAFLEKMNEKAKELNLNNTHFVNEVGLDDSNQYTTVLDLARLTTYALKNPTFTEIVKTREKFVYDATGQKRYYLKNINELLGISGIDGVKTGYTEQAGECLVTSATQNGHRLLSVVLRSQDRFLESASLIEWGFRNFTWKDYSQSNSEIY